MDSRELAEHKQQYDELVGKYRRASEIIMPLFVEYRRSHPKQVRVVFSREPSVKTFKSIIKKIEDKRKNGNRNYSFGHLTDLIALTVLCPYRDDVRKFIVWLKKSFTVHSPDEEAVRDDLTGHRGYHYIFSLSDDMLHAHPEFRGIRCEVQIKTLLEEAFDAKSHDLTYKPGGVVVPAELKNQFGILSSALKVIDDQSEFLRRLILREEHQMELRRDACIVAYLSQDDTMVIGSRLSIALDTIEEETALHISRALSRHESQNGVSTPLCKFATLCALKADDEFLKQEALSYADRLIDKHRSRPKEISAYLTRSYIRWAFGQYEEALDDVEHAIRKSDNKNPRLLNRAKNNFIYYIADWKALRKQENADWTLQAGEFVDQLNQQKNYLDAKDSIGFFKVVFSADDDEVENGLEILRSCKRQRPDSPVGKKFYEYHRYFAIQRLLRDDQG